MKSSSVTVVGAKSDEQLEKHIVLQYKIHLKTKFVVRIGHNIRFKKTSGKFISTFLYFMAVLEFLVHTDYK